MIRGFTESVVEDAALDWLESLGWTVAHGPDIAPGTLCRNRKALTKTEVSTTALFGILPAFLVHDVQNLRFLSRRRFPRALTLTGRNNTPPFVNRGAK